MILSSSFFFSHLIACMRLVYLYICTHHRTRPAVQQTGASRPPQPALPNLLPAISISIVSTVKVNSPQCQQAQIIANLFAMCFVGAHTTRNRLPATHVGPQTQCGVNFFILDPIRVLDPAPKVLGFDTKTHLKARFCAMLKKKGQHNV